MGFRRDTTKCIASCFFSSAALSFPFSAELLILDQVSDGHENLLVEQEEVGLVVKENVARFTAGVLHDFDNIVNVHREHVFIQLKLGIKRTRHTDAVAFQRRCDKQQELVQFLFPFLDKL